MRVRRGAQFTALLALLLLVPALFAIKPDTTSESPWFLFEIMDHGVASQDISGSQIAYTTSGPPPLVTVIDIGSGQTRLLEDFRPCGEFFVIDKVRIDGDWLVAEIKCLDVSEPFFQSHVHNLKTGETFLLQPEPSDPALPYSWYTDIDSGRVVWSQLAGCDGGDVYLLDLETRDLTKVTDGPDGKAKLDLHLGPEWLVWDEINPADREFSLRGANLVTSQTITVTHGSRSTGYVPLSGSGAIVWTESVIGPNQVWAYDLQTQDTYQLSTAGDPLFAFDLSGNLLVLVDSVELGEVTRPATMRTGASSEYPTEPCEHLRPYAGSHNRVRIHNLASHTDEYIYFNPEARYISNARIDQLTVIWDEYAGQYPDDTQRVLAARRFEHQFYMPLVFR